MTNSSTVVEANEELNSALSEDVFAALWLTGVCVSLFGLMMQTILFILIKNARKFDELILWQMTIARTLYTICEHHIEYYLLHYSLVVRSIIFVIYTHSDMVLLCLMFIFSKNLYNKVVVVFPIQSSNLVLTSIITWTAPLPVSWLCPFLIIFNEDYFRIYYKIYAHMKFFICVLNALVFIEIIRVAFSRGASNSGRNVVDFLKVTLISFTLVSITSLQVLLTDVISYCYNFIESRTLFLSLCVINSYQVVVMTAIMLVLMKSKINDSMIRLVTIKLNDLVASFT